MGNVNTAEVAAYRTFKPESSTLKPTTPTGTHDADLVTRAGEVAAYSKKTASPTEAFARMFTPVEFPGQKANLLRFSFGESSDIDPVTGRPVLSTTEVFAGSGSEKQRYDQLDRSLLGFQEYLKNGGRIEDTLVIKRRLPNGKVETINRTADVGAMLQGIDTMISTKWPEARAFFDAYGPLLTGSPPRIDLNSPRAKAIMEFMNTPGAKETIGKVLGQTLNEVKVKRVENTHRESVDKEQAKVDKKTVEKTAADKKLADAQTELDDLQNGKGRREQKRDEADAKLTALGGEQATLDARRAVIEAAYPGTFAGRKEYQKVIARINQISTVELPQVARERGVLDTEITNWDDPAVKAARDTRIAALNSTVILDASTDAEKARIALDRANGDLARAKATLVSEQ
jgi:hypothetical protein